MAINKIDKIAHDIESIVDVAFRRDSAVEVKNFTPSINAGRRYIGLLIEGKQVMVQIDVTDLEKE